MGGREGGEIQRGQEWAASYTTTTERQDTGTDTDTVGIASPRGRLDAPRPSGLHGRRRWRLIRRRVVWDRRLGGDREGERERGRGRGWRVRGKWSGRVEGKDGMFGTRQTRPVTDSRDLHRSNVRGGMRKCLAVIVE